MAKARVQWFIEGVTPAPRCFPGVMTDEDGNGWSVVFTRLGDEIDVGFLVPEAPELVPGMAFDVFQGRTKTCRIEVLK